MDYAKNGWTVTTTRAVTSPETPEEGKLTEALGILTDLTTTVERLPVTPRTSLQLDNDLSRLTAIVEDVKDFVSDYHHLHARVEELEAELDDRDEKIASLEERVVELDETLNGAE